MYLWEAIFTKEKELTNFNVDRLRPNYTRKPYFDVYQELKALANGKGWLRLQFISHNYWTVWDLVLSQAHHVNTHTEFHTTDLLW